MTKSDWFLNLNTFFRNTEKPLYYAMYFEFFLNNILFRDSFLSAEIQNDDSYLFNPLRNQLNTIIDEYQNEFPNDVIGYFETFRSANRQLYLYNLGRTQIKSLGTHFYGLAVDIVNFKDNKIQWRLNYDWLIERAKKVGIHNLYPYESCHFQLIKPNQQKSFNDLYKSFAYFFQKLLKVNSDGIIGKNTRLAFLQESENISFAFKALISELNKSFI